MNIFVRYKINEKGCWIWPGPFDKDGYAISWVGGRGPGRKAVRIARWMWERKHGRPMASDKMACHNCDCPPCINPDHIYEGTHQTNRQDSIARGRRRRKLSDEQVREIRVLEGPITADISRRYKVRYDVISGTRSRKYYADVPDYPLTKDPIESNKEQAA